MRYKPFTNRGACGRLGIASRSILILCGAAACIPGTSAHAGIDAAAPSATVRVEGGGVAAAASSGNFSILAWVRPSVIQYGNVLQLQGALQLRLEADGSVSATLSRASGNPALLLANAAIELQPDEWALLAMSFTAAGGKLDVWAVSESQPLAGGAAQAGGFTPGPPGNTTAIGAWGDPAMPGRYAMMVARDHAIVASDVQAVWDSRRHHAPFSMDTIASGGSMNGAEGVKWMINHAMTTRPLPAGAGGPNLADRAALVGEPVTNNNFHIYDPTHGSAPFHWNAVRKVWVTLGMIHASPFDPPGEGFFVRDLPELSEPLPSPSHVAGEAPKARQLATGPAQLLRVIASANSRGVEGDDWSGKGGGNYAAGFIGLNMEQAAGILNRRASLDREPWFGFNSAAEAPFTVGEVTVTSFTDFARFWTNGFHGNATGPGFGLRLAPGAIYALRCKPQGLIKAEQPLIVQAHALRFPGASAVHWIPNRHTGQGGPGADVGKPFTVPLDTQTYSHALNAAAGDTVVSASRIILAGDHTSNIAIGHACYVNGSISIVDAISYSGGTQRTTIDFEHPLGSAPVNGAMLRFGPWGFETIEFEWSGLGGGDPATWRGLKLAADGSPDGAGAIVYAFSAWRPGVNGYAIGTAGWAGQGYTPQIQKSFRSAMTAWMQALAPDVWLQGFAQQGSAPSAMSDFAAKIREALPGVEIVWLGDMQHNWSDTFEAWHRYILETAESEGVVAVSALMDERLGNQYDLFSDGLRSDPIHITQRGNERLAAIWTEALLDAAIDSNEPEVIGDLNGDGHVDVQDLLILLSSWGACPAKGPCPADLNGNGSVDVQDLLILLSNWG